MVWLANTDPLGYPPDQSAELYRHKLRSEQRITREFEAFVTLLGMMFTFYTIYGCRTLLKHVANFDIANRVDLVSVKNKLNNSIITMPLWFAATTCICLANVSTGYDVTISCRFFNADNPLNCDRLNIEANLHLNAWLTEISGIGTLGLLLNAVYAFYRYRCFRTLQTTESLLSIPTSGNNSNRNSDASSRPSEIEISDMQLNDTLRTSARLQKAMLFFGSDSSHQSVHYQSLDV